MSTRLLSNKRKEDFLGVFSKCHLQMLLIEVEVLQLDNGVIGAQIKKGLVDEHNRLRQENKQMFVDTKSNGKKPNYQMLTPVYKFYLKEIQFLKDKLYKKPSKNKNLIKKAVFVYIHRLNMVNDLIYYAGTKSENDLYSKAQGSSDWELLSYHTEELVHNTEQKCKQNYEKVSHMFKKIVISTYKSDNSLPDQKSQAFDKFLNSEFKKLSYGGEFEKSIENIKKKDNLKLSNIFPKMIATFLSNKDVIEDDFQQVMAAPNFEILRNTFMLGDDVKVTKMKAVFIDENIKTNKMLNISINTFQAILKEDLVSKVDEDSSNTVRPFMVKNCEELTMDAKDLLPPTMNKSKDGDIFQIRLISPRDLENIENYLNDKNFEKRVISQNQNDFKSLMDYNKENELIEETIITSKHNNEVELEGVLPIIITKTEFENTEEFPDKAEGINNVMNSSSKFVMKEQNNLQVQKEEEPRDKSVLKPEILNQIYLDDDYPVDMHIQNKSPPKCQNKLNLINLSSENRNIFNKDVSLKKHFETVMINFHGGGFVAMSSSQHLLYLIPWAKKCDIPIFSVDYRLACPNRHYPIPVNDSIAGYLWVQYFVEKVLEVKIKTLLITGDSAGGNQAFAVTNWCIVNGIRAPDFIFANYPVVQMNIKTYFTPSMLLAMNDAFLNYSSLKMCFKYYIPEGKRAEQDSYISSYGTPDWVLQRYPRTVMSISEFDSQKDDAFRFASRLLLLENDVKVYFNKFMPHGLLNLGISKDIPEANMWTQKSYEILKEYVKERREYIDLTEKNV